MNPINRLLARKAILALAVSGALIGSGGVAASSAAGGPATGAIKAGAGPGWPATITPSDFVPHVTNPWFPLKPGSVWHYKGSRKG